MYYAQPIAPLHPSLELSRGLWRLAVQEWIRDSKNHLLRQASALQCRPRAHADSGNCIA